MKPIVKIPNPVLTTPAKPVTQFDKRLTSILETMKKTLIATKNPKGVGLAAPQIDESYRIFITRQTEKSPIRVFINPEIVEFSEESTKGEVPERDNKLEGCLSVPQIWGKVNRAARIRLSYQDEKGARHEETIAGFLATIIQHETDHVNGILFVTRVLEQKGAFYQSVKDKDGKETLEEIELK